ncbi:phage tail tape measure protein [Acidimangrovimonas sediminis]|uniref:phage tail tape measure protein n=1 Tax=Acidimangrovimonas sediminis TaxID=2056283 RepID=UPI000C80EED8|nr:phage tail tape measure protein [Acidimangrovimonas sediminis]
MTTDLTDLAQGIDALEATLGGSAEVVTAFDGALSSMRDSLVFTSREVNTLSRGIGWGLRRAFDGLVFDGKSLSDALDGVAKSMVDSVYAIAMRPVQNAVGGAIATGLESVMSSIQPFANGAPFSQGRVMPFARGGVVAQPTGFAMRGGRGLMGEAGPEAIMPLTRGPDGRLGVQAAGGGGAVNVVMNVTTPDVANFRRSQSQVAAQLGRALSRGQRNR